MITDESKTGLGYFSAPNSCIVMKMKVKQKAINQSTEYFFTIGVWKTGRDGEREAEKFETGN
jgi:hypothetical protein